MEQLLQTLNQYWQLVIDFFIFDTALLSEPDMIIRLGIQLCLLLCSAFFSSSETALFSLSRLDLQQLRREQNPRSETIHELLDQPRKLIISILSGNELVNIAAAVNMTSILISLYQPDKVMLINLLVMVPLLLLFGEVTPKTIAVSNPVRYSTSIVAAPLALWINLIAPIRWAIRGIADWITTRIVGEAKAASMMEFRCFDLSRFSNEWA
jgi:putative hemolysin